MQHLQMLIHRDLIIRWTSGGYRRSGWASDFMAHIPFTYVRISRIAASQINNSSHKINHSIRANLILAPATRVAKSQTQHDG